jgi:dienelactone hydrolase
LLPNSYNQINQKENPWKNGYDVLAIDLFNGETTTDQNRAGQLTSKIRENPNIVIENMKSAVRYLNSLPNVNASTIASLG